MQKVYFKIIIALLRCILITIFITDNMRFLKQKSNIKIKIILVDLGKNEIIRRNIKQKFGTKYKLSVGIDILTKNIEIGNGLNGTLLIWNISGENIFDIVTDLYNKEDEITLIVFDLTKIKTFEQMIKYLSNIRKLNFDEHPYVLIGNKSNFLKKDDLLVYSMLVKNYAIKEGCIYLETSTEDNSYLDEAFSQLAREIINYKVLI